MIKRQMRLSRVQKNTAEAAFQAKAAAAGWKTTKRGWPDFLCWNDEGDICVVEVKPAANYNPSFNQRSILQLLADHGVPAYRWDPESGFKRIKTNPKRHARARARLEELSGREIPTLAEIESIIALPARSALR